MRGVGGGVLVDEMPVVDLGPDHLVDPEVKNLQLLSQCDSM